MKLLKCFLSLILPNRPYFPLTLGKLFHKPIQKAIISENVFITDIRFGIKILEFCLQIKKILKSQITYINLNTKFYPKKRLKKF